MVDQASKLILKALHGMKKRRLDRSINQTLIEEFLHQIGSWFYRFDRSNCGLIDRTSHMDLFFEAK